MNQRNYWVVGKGQTGNRSMSAVFTRTVCRRGDFDVVGAVIRSAHGLQEEVVLPLLGAAVMQEPPI